VNIPGAATAAPEKNPNKCNKEKARAVPYVAEAEMNIPSAASDSAREKGETRKKQLAFLNENQHAA
jgi:hypothetical protein